MYCCATQIYTVTACPVPHNLFYHQPVRARTVISKQPITRYMVPIKIASLLYVRIRERQRKTEGRKTQIREDSPHIKSSPTKSVSKVFSNFF